MGGIAQYLHINIISSCVYSKFSLNLGARCNNKYFYSNGLPWYLKGFHVPSTSSCVYQTIVFYLKGVRKYVQNNLAGNNLC